MLNPPEQTVLLLTTAKNTLEQKLKTDTYQRYQDLARTGETFGFRLLAAFPEDIRLKTRTFMARSLVDVKPYAIIGEEQLPSVIYNRISTRKDEWHYAALLKTLQMMPGVIVFNPGFFNKWTLLELLKDKPSWSFKIPESGRVQGDLPNGLDALFSRLESQEQTTIYLKPIHGHAGLGIMTLEMRQAVPMIRSTRPLNHNHLISQHDDWNQQDSTRYASCHYQLTLQTAQGLQYTRVDDKETLTRLIAQLSKHKPYMWQQGVPRPITPVLPNLGAVDIRALMQKKSDGRWQLSGWALRAASSNGITTHTPRGGFRPPRWSTLKQLYPNLELEPFLKRLKTATYTITETIDAYYRHRLGELSLDFALGKEGMLWFLEANSKPMRFDEKRIEAAWRRTFWEAVTYFMKRSYQQKER